MVICFTLDDVFRSKTLQFGKFYKKVINPDIDLDNIEVNTDDLYEVFEFDSRRDYNKFLYSDCVFEIFGDAPVTDKMLDKNFNLWHLNLSDDDDLKDKVQLMIANPFEFNSSIGYTCFFLSKIATRIRDFYFPTDSLTIWDKCDVLVTANTKLLNNKPEGKISIKIDMPYNKDCESDYSYENLLSFINDSKIINELVSKNNG